MTGKEPVRIVVVGMGARSMIYAEESLRHPEWFRVVGAVDINPERLRAAREKFSISEEHCFSSVEEFVRAPRFADAVINGTMDPEHVVTTVPLLEHGYDVLLEKPFAVNEKEAEELLACVRRTGRTVLVCHVLRYAPFYRKIREALAQETIGTVIHIQMGEQVSYFHESVSYVRGKYASPEICGSGMLLSKCSHDLDIMAWLMAGNLPEAISSLGSVLQFRPEMAPEGAGNRCLMDCPVERDCIYSARRLYLEHPQRWTNNIWHDMGMEQPSEKEKEASLKDSANPYGRCVYQCGLQIVDHQSVLIGFENGATGSFSMNGGASASGRTIHITGTRGEIAGTFEQEAFTIARIAPGQPNGRTIENIDVSKAQNGNAHGNGDQAIVRDFIRLLQGIPGSECATTLEDSIIGHRMVFLAEASREKGGEVQKFQY